MQTLLAETRSPEPLPLVAPAQNKKPGLAFGLSLMLPGLGHFYLKKPKTALWVLTGTLACLVMMFSASPSYIGTGLLGVPAIYIFATADAFWSAREWNAGATGRMIGTNPRIAAILNLLTKGFGYFYLGQRSKGITIFILMSLAQAALNVGHIIWLRLAAVSLQIFTAADGYRTGRQHLLDENPELASAGGSDANRSFAESGPCQDASKGDPITPFNTGTLPPAFVTIILVLLAVASLAAYVTFATLNGHNNRGQATIENGPAGLAYKNVPLGLELTAPADWTASDTSTALVRMESGSCVVAVGDNTVFLSAAPLVNATKAGALTRHPDVSIGPAADWHGKNAATGFTITRIGEGGRIIHENGFFLRHGLHLTSIFEVYPAENASCQSDLVKVERSIILTR